MSAATDKPMFEVNERTVIEVVAVMQARFGNWLAMLYADTPAGPFRQDCRVRIQVDDKHDWEGSGDIKIRLPMPPVEGASQEERKESFRRAMLLHKSMYDDKGSDVAEQPVLLDVYGNIDRLMEVFQAHPELGFQSKAFDKADGGSHGAGR